MSTAFYNMSESHALNQSSTSTAIKTSIPLAKSPPSRSNFRDDHYACGRSQVSDNDLITAAQSGDQQAFVELCMRHSHVVKRKILRIVRNQEDAEDALQDTLLQAYTHLASFRGFSKFSTWITAIGVNSALMIMRKRRIRRETFALTSNPDTRSFEEWEHVDPSLGPEGLYLKRQAILLVRREVQKLRPTLRSVVNHYYGSDDSMEESAKALDISLSAAKSRLRRGRVRLRSSLERYGIFKSSN